MVDNLSKEIRSRIMSAIHSRWTKPEKKLHNFLKGNKIRHKMHPDLAGKPDALLVESGTVIFVDGCFWHHCPVHGAIPATNELYWIAKIKNNVYRDKKNSQILKKEGYRVIRLWECEIMSPEFNLSKIKKKVEKNDY
jgi:DNA mismatch endonuclease, patch repair protein